MRLRQALKKYSADIYKRSELVKGKLVVRRIPAMYTTQGWMETLLRPAIMNHSGRYGLGEYWGTVGYVLDSALETTTFRCSAHTFIRAERLPITTSEDDFVTTAPDLIIEYINQPELKDPEFQKYSHLPPEHDNEDSDDYWPTKIADFQRFGVGLLWILDLTAEVVHEFRQPAWQSVTFKRGQVLDAGEYFPGFRLPVEDLFTLDKLDKLFKYDSPLDPELVAYVARKHEAAGLKRERTIAEMDLEILRLEAKTLDTSRPKTKGRPKISNSDD